MNVFFQHLDTVCTVASEIHSASRLWLSRLCVRVLRRPLASLQVLTGLHSLQVFQGKVVEGDPNQCGHIICTVAGSGPSKQTINYSTERVVGNGSFGVVFQATCLESGETVGLSSLWCSALHGTCTPLDALPI